MKEILGQARVDQDLEVLPCLGEDILRSGVMVLLLVVRWRGARLLRHDVLLLLVLLKLELLLLLLRALALVLNLARIHGQRSHGDGRESTTV